MHTPHPDHSPAGAARSAAEIRAWIVEQLAGLLNVAPSSIDPAAPLDSLGIDSLAAIGMTSGLAGWLGLDLPATLMWDYASIDAIAHGLAGGGGDAPAGPAARPGVIDLQPGGDARAVFFLPGLGGHPASFARLATLLGPRYPCYGLTVPGLHGSGEPLTRVEDVAAAMLENLRRVRPAGPYQLVGYSFGGLLAYEMARQLSAAGEAISLLAIFDAFTPAGRRTRPRWQRLALHTYLLLTQPRRRQYLREHLRRWRTGGAAAEAGEGDAAAGDPTPAERVKQVVSANVRAAEQYLPGPYAGEVVLFRATERALYSIFFRVDPANGWGALAGGGVRVIDLPGSHLGLLDANNAPAAAEALRPYLSA